MAIDILYPNNGERREITTLGNNQIPMAIHTTNQLFTFGGTYDFDWAGNDFLRDVGGYYDPGISSSHFIIPHEGFYNIQCSIELSPDPAETGTFEATLFNSSHGGFFTSRWSGSGVPLASGPTYFAIGNTDYFFKGEYAALGIIGNNMVADFYVTAFLSITAVV